MPDRRSPARHGRPVVEWLLEAAFVAGHDVVEVLELQAAVDYDRFFGVGHLVVPEAQQRFRG